MTGKSVKCTVVLFLLLAAAQGLAQVKIKKINFKGWNDAIRISGDRAEIVIVPSIGRVMQFGFSGGEGLFWINEKLAGKHLVPDAKEWLNFGGDKVWPAPIADWRRMLNRKPTEPNFPPAPGFDGLPFTAKVGRDTVELVSQVDPFYGIRVRRTVRLDGAVMKIRTTFEKTAGEPVRVSVWTVTQLNDPQKIFLLLPEKSRFSDGFTKLSAEKPPSLVRRNRLLMMDRDTQKPFKIGSDALKMLWVGERLTLEISAPREKNDSYPDDNANIEVYTAPDPLGYVEFETLGSLKTLEKGDKTSLTTTYVLRRRSTMDARGEAEKLWREKSK